jgi:bis(5'-nucleosyl)-tetraphosphatase (symmetrical)
MATYVIGDVQGCFTSLTQLLQKIHFSTEVDQLWFTGDLINRGPQSLETLRFVKSLGDNAITVLGNHDLHLLAVACGHAKMRKKDNFTDILNADDGNELCQWLLQQPLLHHDQQHNITLVHAGFPPQWDLATAQQCAHEVTDVLRDPTKRHAFFTHMYGRWPNRWKPSLKGKRRLRFITNALTRIRFVTKRGRLKLRFKGTIADAPKRFIPWFAHPDRQTQHNTIIFGHWAALAGKTEHANAIATDTGCCWGGSLTAYCIETGERVCIDCH